MEFKEDSWLTHDHTIVRINRIRLEFKVGQSLSSGLQGSGINRIRLEFKDQKLSVKRFPLFVLIESDWNLKLIVWVTDCLVRQVLIESDWNLKETWSDFGTALESVLIESDWNLKHNYIRETMTGKKVLIESDWNLKETAGADTKGAYTY